MSDIDQTTKEAFIVDIPIVQKAESTADDIGALLKQKYELQRRIRNAKADEFDKKHPEIAVLKKELVASSKVQLTSVSQKQRKSPVSKLQDIPKPEPVKPVEAVPKPVETAKPSNPINIKKPNPSAVLINTVVSNPDGKWF